MFTTPLTELETKVMRRRMAYVSYDDSCKDPTIDTTGELRECRMLSGHETAHASDFPFYAWGK